MQLWNITSLQNRKHLSRNKSMGRFSPSHQTQSKLIILIKYGDIQSKCVHLAPNLFLKSVFKVWFCRHDNQQGPLLPFTQVKLTSNVIVPFYTSSVHTHVVFELMFLTYDQLPRSIIVGTRGELTALECGWKTLKNKPENWRVRSYVMCSCQERILFFLKVMWEMIIIWWLSLEAAH